MTLPLFYCPPWRAEAGGKVTTSDGLVVCSVWRRKGALADSHFKATLRLIAAAPKLYRLLKELVDIEGPQPGTATWAKKVDEALAEVEGAGE